MFSPNVLEMFKTLIDHGIEISLFKKTDNTYYADLNTRAKSHLHVCEKDGVVVFEMRYEKESKISADEDPLALVYQAASCYAYECICGRDFGSKEWDALCEELDITVCYGKM